MRQLSRFKTKPGEDGSDYINANFILVSAINFNLKHRQIFAGDDIPNFVATLMSVLIWIQNQLTL